MFLQGDGALTLQDQMDVMDRLKDGGVEKVGIVAKFPERALRAAAWLALGASVARRAQDTAMAEAVS